MKCRLCGASLGLDNIFEHAACVELMDRRAVAGKCTMCGGPMLWEFGFECRACRTSPDAQYVSNPGGG